MALSSGPAIRESSACPILLPKPLNNPLQPRCFALVPCAGKGERAGTRQPKQYEPIAGLPMVHYTLQALASVSRLQAILVVLHPEDNLFEQHVPHFPGLVARVGGPTRAQSVLNGLLALRSQGAHEADWVLVHDAARCLLQAPWVDALIDACEHDPVGGLLALPVADTLKQAQGDRVACSISRSQKWQAQTPQMFRLGALESALQQALAGSPDMITDESSAIEATGERPKLVMGSLENFKLTYPPDFELADKLLRMRS